MTLTTNLSIGIATTLSKALDHSSPQAQIVKNLTTALTNVLADQVFADNRTLSASTSEDLDLAGSLTNALGDTITFASIKAIIIKAGDANGGNMTIGGAASNAFEAWTMAAGDGVLLRPGGTFVLIAPTASDYAVTATTADLLKIANLDGAAAATYDIYLIGKE